MRCYAVGGQEYGAGPGSIIASLNGGHSWQVLETTPGSWFAAIACPTATDCTVVGGRGNGDFDSPVILSTTDGGEHWTDGEQPGQMDSLLDVACPSLRTCVAVGPLLPVSPTTFNASGIARTTDAGATWTVENAPTGMASLDAVTCPTRSFCVIGGSGPGPGATSPSMDAVSENAGASWAAGVVAGGPSGLAEISCTDARDCVGLIGSDATDTYGTASAIVTSDGGLTWTKPSKSVGGAVSCVETLCVSVGGLYQSSTMTFPADAFLSTDGGRNWSPMRVTTSDSFTAAACTSTAHCVAVGGSYDDSSSVIATYDS